MHKISLEFSPFNACPFFSFTNLPSINTYSSFKYSFYITYYGLPSESAHPLTSKYSNLPPLTSPLLAFIFFLFTRLTDGFLPLRAKQYKIKVKRESAFRVIFPSSLRQCVLDVFRSLKLYLFPFIFKSNSSLHFS